MAKGSAGLEENIAGLLSYIIGIVGLVLFFIEKESKFIKFHAAQSILLNLAIFIPYSILSVLTRIPGLGLIFMLVSFAWFVIGVVAVIFTAIKAYKMEEFKLPVIGDIASNLANK